MESPSRREKIEAMLQDEPHDTFLRYSLAMELEKEGQHEASLERFRALMADQPPHIPAFFMAAKLLTRLRNIEGARSLLREGIEQARLQGNLHAASEMGELLMALGAQQP